MRLPTWCARVKDTPACGVPASAVRLAHHSLMHGMRATLLIVTLSSVVSAEEGVICEDGNCHALPSQKRYLLVSGCDPGDCHILVLPSECKAQHAFGGTHGFYGNLSKTASGIFQGNTF